MCMCVCACARNCFFASRAKQQRQPQEEEALDLKLVVRPHLPGFSSLLARSTGLAADRLTSLPHGQAVKCARVDNSAHRVGTDRGPGWEAVSLVSFREIYLKESVDTVPTHTNCELGMFFCPYVRRVPILNVLFYVIVQYLFLFFFCQMNL